MDNLSIAPTRQDIHRSIGMLIAHNEHEFRCEAMMLFSALVLREITSSQYAASIQAIAKQYGIVTGES